MNFLGIGSGLDLSSMLEGLVKVASEPKVQQLGRREIQVEDSLSGLGILKSALSDFQSASDALKDSDLYSTMTPTLTQPSSGDLIKVEAGSNAVASNYDIEVVTLAQGSKATSDWRSVKYQSDVFSDTTTALNSAGSLSFNGKGITIDATDSLKDIHDKINADADLKAEGITAKIVDGRLEYSKKGTNEALVVTGLSAFANDATGEMTERADSAKDTNLGGKLTFEADGKTFEVNINPTDDAADELKSLEDIVAAINNAEDNFGVTANIIDGKLVYQSSVTGVGNDLTVTASDGTDAAGNAITKSASLDQLTTGASNMVVGSSATDAEIMVDGVSIKNDSNTFDGAVAGLTITALKQSKDAETAGVAIGNSSGDVKSKIDAFTKAYNNLRTKMNELKGENTEEGFVAGKLTNDPIIRNVESVLNSVMTSVGQDADEKFNTLFAIGLEIQDDGTLASTGDAADRMTDALSGSMDSLKKLFAGDGDASNKGLADQISEQIDNYVGFTGIIKGKEDSFQEQLDDLDDQYEAHARYIESYQKTLKQQFTALDATMAKMNSIMQYIGPQLAALPGVAK